MQLQNIATKVVVDQTKNQVALLSLFNIIFLLSISTEDDDFLGSLDK